MKTKAFGITITLLVFAVAAFAQDYAFKVLVNKGKNEVKAGNNWQLLKVGSSLNSADEFRLGENAYLGLVHISGKPVEVKDAGNYKVKDLADKVNGGASVLNKYTDFILSSNNKPKNNLSATGAVHRGLADQIKVFLPPTSSYVFNDSVSIQWEEGKGSPPYTVIFTSLFGDALKKIETNGNSLVINLDDPDFTNQNDVTLQIFSKDNDKESEQYTLRKFSKSDRERIKMSFSEIASQTREHTALNKLVQAGFFEQNKLMADAATAYQQAIQLAPDVSYYQEMYESFLLRNGLKSLKEEKK